MVLDRASEYVGEAMAYLRRRRETRRPFARVQWEGGRGSAYGSDSEAGRALFRAAAELIELARDESRRG